MNNDDFNDFNQTERLIEYLKFVCHIQALGAIKKLEDYQHRVEGITNNLSNLDPEIARNIKFIKSKAPKCERCTFSPYGLDDPKRYAFVVETKVFLLPFLFRRSDKEFRIQKSWFYDDYKKQLIIVCPIIGCGTCVDLDKVKFIPERLNAMFKKDVLP
jgi:hypothetical protein